MKDDIREFFTSMSAKRLSYKSALQFSQQLNIELTRLEAEYVHTSFGVPIIQLPIDQVLLGEIIWSTRPTVVIETGFARGGSSIHFAGQLLLLNYPQMDRAVTRKVISIDIDPRPHNVDVVRKHPFGSMISVITGSSVDRNVFEKCEKLIQANDRVMVVLDSNHSRQHVTKELELYSRLVSVGCYLCVSDTHISFLPQELIGNRPWNNEDGPAQAVDSFLKVNNNFKRDEQYQYGALGSSSADGYLVRTA